MGAANPSGQRSPWCLLAALVTAALLPPQRRCPRPVPPLPRALHTVLAHLPASRHSHHIPRLRLAFHACASLSPRPCPSGHRGSVLPPHPSPHCPLWPPAPLCPTETRVGQGQERRSHLSVGSAAQQSCRHGSAVAACGLRHNPAPRTPTAHTGDEVHRKTYSNHHALTWGCTASGGSLFHFEVKTCPLLFQEFVHERPAPPAACNCQLSASDRLTRTLKFSIIP